MATAKQIAWRKKFAEMARSGALKRKRAKKNPAPKKRVTPAPKRRAANPAPKKRSQTPRGGCNPEYAVQIKRSGRWSTITRETSQARAEDVARTLHALGITSPVRVWG